MQPVKAAKGAAKGVATSLRKMAEGETPAGIYDLQASYTLSLFFTLVGMMPAVIFAAEVYYHDECVQCARMYRRVPHLICFLSVTTH